MSPINTHQRHGKTRLPVAVCDDYKEAASYLGISTHALASNICRNDLINYKYRAARYTAKELKNDKT